MSDIVIRTRRDNVDALLAHLKKVGDKRLGEPTIDENVINDNENVVELYFDDEDSERVHSVFRDGGFPGPCTGHWDDIDGQMMFAGTGHRSNHDVSPRGAWHDADGHMNIKITGDIETGLPTARALEDAAEFAALWKKANEAILSDPDKPLPMHDYAVTVERTATRELTITVKATNSAEARRIALDTAGNYDFANGQEGDPDYKVFSDTRLGSSHLLSINR